MQEQNSFIQNLINNINEQSKRMSGKEYNLGNFINDLKVYKDEYIKVEFDDGTNPTDFDSWRGSYCELALNYNANKTMTTNELYRKAFNANNSIFEGYKGGDFLMDLETPIHQANYGEVGVKQENGDYENKKIIGIKEADNKIIILTKNDD